LFSINVDLFEHIYIYIYTILVSIHVEIISLLFLMRLKRCSFSSEISLI